MEFITKSPEQCATARLKDYEESYRDFRWEEIYRQSEARRTQEAGDQGTCNMAYAAIDRHARDPIGAQKIALKWCGKDGNFKEYTYADLFVQTNKFANVLKNLGIEKGQTVIGLLGRVPELYVAVLGTLKHRSIFSPLFAAFGPDPIKSRMLMGKGKVIITNEKLYFAKIKGIENDLPDLKHIIIVDPKPGTQNYGPKVKTYPELMECADRDYLMGPTMAEDPALIHFTSGTTGKPKGALHVHQAIVHHEISGQLALDMQAGDTYWCTADPGWVTGMSYGILSPLANQLSVVVDEGEFDAERWYHLIEKNRINIWYTAPTAIRMMMKLGEQITKNYNFSSLRFIASVGEPLNPEAVRWGLRVFGHPIHDNWWQSETGGIMIANFASMAIKPGSMGKPVPGIEAKVFRRGSDPLQEANPDEEGELALKTPWPSLFRGYLGQEDRYQKCFKSGYYFTGDLAKKDGDQYFWFIGRADDVIKSAGHLIGPFEVESALVEHPAVAEAAVIGKPDPLLGEVVKAFLTLKNAFSPTDDVKRDILAHARKKLGPAVAPREIVIVANLPRTRSGKIMRRLLRARELGLPEGDTSTLESQFEECRKGE